MGTVTVRKIDDDTMRDLKISAARRGVSMEQEARDRLRQPVAASQERRRIDVDKILSLGVKPEKPFDLKKFTDEMWDESLS